MTYKYGMRLRGFSIGCQPMTGFVERQDDTTGRYHDVLVYDRELTEQELKDYELDYLGGDKMKDDEIALAVCSHATAQMLMEKEKDSDVIDALVITNVVDDNTVYLIPKQEFLDYLEEKDKKVRE